MQVELEVAGLTVDPVNNNAPVVVLKEKERGRILPIWIGVIEATAIAFELENLERPRPMTHDLLKNVIESLDARVARVVIADLRDHTYFATVVLQRGDSIAEIDARPSDAIAIALRTKAPILCEKKVMDAAHVRKEDWEARKNRANQNGRNRSKRQPEGEAARPQPIMDTDKAAVDGFLENLGPEAFGKYKM